MAALPLAVQLGFQLQQVRQMVGVMCSQLVQLLPVYLERCLDLHLPPVYIPSTLLACHWVQYLARSWGCSQRTQLHLGIQSRPEEDMKKLLVYNMQNARTQIGVCKQG